jgi:hypothetical protein
VAWQSWLWYRLFILGIRVQISAQTDNIFLFCLCHIWICIGRVLTLEHKFVNIHVCWLIILDPTRHVAKDPKPQYQCGKVPSKKMWFKILSICIQPLDQVCNLLIIIIKCLEVRKLFNFIINWPNGYSEYCLDQ